MKSIAANRSLNTAINWKPKTWILAAHERLVKRVACLILQGNELRVGACGTGRRTFDAMVALRNKIARVCCSNTSTAAVDDRQPQRFVSAPRGTVLAFATVGSLRGASMQSPPAVVTRSAHLGPSLTNETAVSGVSWAAIAAGGTARGRVVADPFELGNRAWVFGDFAVGRQRRIGDRCGYFDHRVAARDADFCLRSRRVPRRTAAY